MNSAPLSLETIQFAALALIGLIIFALVRFVVWNRRASRAWRPDVTHHITDLSTPSANVHEGVIQATPRDDPTDKSAAERRQAERRASDSGSH